MQSDNVKDSIKDIQKDELLSDRKSFIVLKIERIVIAAYRVTDFLPNDEPLKLKIRSIASEMVISRPSRIPDLLSNISALFTIAREAQIGSSMNFSILLQECELTRVSLINEEKVLIKREYPEPPLSRAVATPSHTRKQSQESGSRAEKILQILKERGESSIGAIAGELPSVSEKTVQRELITLVDNGVVNRVGERRWSRYRIAESD